jgi:hypothetical protein
VHERRTSARPSHVQLGRLEGALLDLDEVPFQPRQGITSADQVVLNLFEEPFTLLGC